MQGRLLDRARELARKSMVEHLNDKVRRVRAAFNAHGKDAALAEVRRQHEEEQLPAERECVRRGQTLSSLHYALYLPPSFSCSCPLLLLLPLLLRLLCLLYPNASSPFPPPALLPFPPCVCVSQRSACMQAPWAISSRR